MSNQETETESAYTRLSQDATAAIDAYVDLVHRRDASPDEVTESTVRMAYLKAALLVRCSRKARS